MEDLSIPFHAKEEVSLSNVVKEEYRNYQIYTLMDRAIPYLQDGLKPSQRRILFTLWKNQSKGLMKVSAATGLVLTLHPHGPPSIESSIVNMAQDYTFANNYPLIDKKGYFGERMETAPAASRYIECRLGKVADLLLFDDMNQVEMVPNYDEKVMEPLYLLPKLPMMLLNGAEGIGTGFSSVIPPFNHKDIIDSMIKYIGTGKPKKLKPWVRNYNEEVKVDERGRIIFKMGFAKIGERVVINELPRGYDATKIYRHLTKHIESNFIKDFIDNTVSNEIEIDLIFKRGHEKELKEVAKTIGMQSAITPNFTLISERGVKILDRVEEIISLFTEQRRVVVKKRYQLLVKDYEERIQKNSEIVRFIKEKHYAQAVKKQNRKSYVEYLGKKKFIFSDYLADMAIYRMTKDEVDKRSLMIKEDKVSLREYKKIAKSDRLVDKKLVEELKDVKTKLAKIMDDKERDRKKAFEKVVKKSKKKK